MNLFKMVKRGRASLRPGFLDYYPGEVFRVNGDSQDDVSGNGASIYSNYLVNSLNDALRIGNYTDAAITETGMLEYNISNSIAFGTGDFTIEFEFTISPKAATVDAFHIVFSLGNYPSQGSITLMKQKSSVNQYFLLRVYGTDGNTIDYTLNDTLIQYGVRTKIAIERYAGRLFLHMNDKLVSAFGKITSSGLFDLTSMKRIHFGDNANGRVCQELHNCRIVKGEAITSKNTLIFGSQLATSGAGAARDVIDYYSPVNTWYTGTTDPNNAWIGIRYPKQMLVSSAYFTLSGQGSTTAYTIEYSNDGVTWTPLYTSPVGNYTGVQTVDLQPVYGKYYRFRMLSGTTINTRGLTVLKFNHSVNWLPAENALIIYGRQYSATTGAGKNAWSASTTDMWFSYVNDTWQTWLGLSYLEPKTFNRSSTQFGGVHTVTGYVVESADDDNVWTIRSTVTGISIVGGTHVTTWPDVTAKKWRMRITSSSNMANKEVYALSFSKV